MNEDEPTIDSRIIKNLVLASFGHVDVQVRKHFGYWERSLVCEVCGARQVFDYLAYLLPNHEKWPAVEYWCKLHRHAEPSMDVEIINLDTGMRRLKDDDGEAY